MGDHDFRTIPLQNVNDHVNIVIILKTSVILALLRLLLQIVCYYDFTSISFQSVDDHDTTEITL